MKLIRTAPTSSAAGTLFILQAAGRQYAAVKYADWHRPVYLDSGRVDERGDLVSHRGSRLVPARCTKLIAAIDAAIEQGFAS